MKLIGGELSAFMERYAQEITPNSKWEHRMFYIGRHIPEKKLANALKSYANLSDGEAPLLLLDNTLLGSAKEGMLLTTSHLHYNILRPNDMEKGCIPLPDISSVFFDLGIVTTNNITAASTIIYINSKPFAYLFTKTNMDDNPVLNDMFGKLSTEQHIDARQQNPEWGFEGEKIIRDLSMHKINGGVNNIIITNARIVERIGRNIRVYPSSTPDALFSFIELSDIQNIRPPTRMYAGKLVLELVGGNRTYIAADSTPYAVQDMYMYLRAALECMIPLISFEDPNEKILAKDKNKADFYDAFCSPELWERIFGDTKNSARFCVTNKRLLYYRVEQASITGSDALSLSYAITRPILKLVWLPLFGITGVTSKKRGLFRNTLLQIADCAPVGQICLTPVVPDICRESAAICYDPERNKAVGAVADIDFNHFHSFGKKERGILEILKGIVPGGSALEI